VARVPNKPTVKPGGTVPSLGSYHFDKSRTRATLVKGEPAPPTPSNREKWKQIADTSL